MQSTTSDELMVVCRFCENEAPYIDMITAPEGWHCSEAEGFVCPECSRMKDLSTDNDGDFEFLDDL